jgi:hypothetical protein
MRMVVMSVSVKYIIRWWALAIDCTTNHSLMRIQSNNDETGIDLGIEIGWMDIKKESQRQIDERYKED